MDKKVIAFFIVIGIFVISGISLGPRITGYTVLQEKQKELESQQQEYEDLLTSYEKNFTQTMSDLISTNKSLVSCEESKNRLYTQVESYMNKTMECKMELRDIEEQCETEKENIQDDLDECETDYAEKSHQYNEIVNYAGNKICCIMKIYNPDIESFDVDLDAYEIKCREGADGQIKIFCQL